MITREPGQSEASAWALGRHADAWRVAADAQWEVRRIQGELREARKRWRAAEKVASAADAAYLATPYADES